MLGTLVLLTAGAVAIAALHYAVWWVVVPPGVVLAGFLLLLREAARSDAAQARRRAEADAAQRGAARTLPGHAAGPAGLADDSVTAPEEIVEIGFSAQIIDISARVTDQFYDQYSDTTTRAVGD